METDISGEDNARTLSQAQTTLALFKRLMINPIQVIASKTWLYLALSRDTFETSMGELRQDETLWRFIQQNVTCVIPEKCHFRYRQRPAPPYGQFDRKPML